MCRIEDLKRSIGIYVNGRLVHSQQLKPFDEVFIMGLSLIYMGDFIAVRNLKTESTLSLMTSFAVKMPINDAAEKKYFVSTPRILKSLDSDVIEIDAPPIPFTVDKTPAILTLGPSITMSMVMLASLGVSITNMPDEEIMVQMTDNTANPIHSAKIDLSGDKSDKTQLEAVVSEIVALGQKKNVVAKPLWLDMLPEKIVLQTLEKEKKGLCPAILVLIDNFASFRDKYMDISDSFIDIISAGKTFGVYFVITGSTRNSIYYKVTEHIATYFTLKMNDPSNYLDIHNVRPPVVPEDISGRGITVINREIVEFQTAIAFDGETEADRIATISQKYIELASNWHGYTPIKLDGATEDSNNSYEAPASYYSPTPRSTPPESIFDESGNLILGTSKSAALMYGITLSEDYKVCICANDTDSLGKFYGTILMNIAQYSNRRLVYYT